jgi:hypothetical protein
MSKATSPPIERPASERVTVRTSVAARAAAEAERRGALLAAAAVVALFGVVLLGWVVLGHAATQAGAERPDTAGNR